MPTILSGNYVVLNGMTLNAMQDNGVMVFMDVPDGLGASPSTFAPVQRVRSDGAWGGASFSGARPIGLSGTIVAPTSDLAQSTLDDLIAASALSSVTLAYTIGSVTRSMLVRRQGDVKALWMSDIEVVWAVIMTALDPRKFGAALSGSTGLPMTSGGFTSPFTSPFTSGATVISGNIVLTNLGNTTAPVTLRLDGPLPGGCVVTHVTSNSALAFATSLAIPAGSWLIADLERRQVTLNGDSSRNGYVTGRNWFGVDPGVNLFAFSAPSFDTGTLTVSSSSAWS